MDFTTPRLHIRDLVEDDVEPLHQLRIDPLVHQFMHFGPETPEETRTWLIETMVYNERSQRDSHNCAIVQRSTGNVIGWIGFGFSHEQGKPIGDVGIGYAILPAYWNQGFTTEALRATLDFIFQTTAAENARAHHDVGNSASGKVMEKAGMRLVNRTQNPDESSPKKAESVHYLLSRAEWAAAKLNSS